MMSAAPLVFDRAQVAEWLDWDACIDAVERAFRLGGQGAHAPSSSLAFPVDGGGFHVKAGLLDLGPPYGPCLAVKTNANFPANPGRPALTDRECEPIRHRIDVISSWTSAGGGAS